MARAQAAQAIARGPSRRRLAAALLPLALASLAASSCSRAFHVSGTITLAAPLQSRARMTNGVLFVIAKNRGGVPLAVKRIVNPQFPVDFSLEPDDLVVPGARLSDALTLEVEMNTHGNVGKPVRGDLEGASPDLVYSGDRDVHVVIDRVRN